MPHLELVVSTLSYKLSMLQPATPPIAPHIEQQNKAHAFVDFTDINSMAHIIPSARPPTYGG
jgi:hypothetical protein